MSLKKIYQDTYNWLNDRLGIEYLIEMQRKKRVPVCNLSIWYYFGGISLFLFMVQVITGILLLMYYRPGVDQSFESLKFIVSKVNFGWLLRDIHSWSANLMVFFVMVHMFSVFFMKSYRKPRELTWVTGMILLALSFGFGFSGYLLPWNELAFFATKVGTDMAGIIPGIGEFMLKVVRGGPDVTGVTLGRFFGIHVAVLPGITTIVLGVHLYLIQRHGLHQPYSFRMLPEDKKKSIPFYPDFMLRDLMLWMAALALVNALAVFFPWELGVKADPFASAPAGIKPEWYFMFMFQALKFLPAHIGAIEGELFGLGVFTLGGAIWMAIPFWDRAAEKSPRDRLMSWIGIVVIAFIIAMTVLGYTLA